MSWQAVCFSNFQFVLLGHGQSAVWRQPYTSDKEFMDCDRIWILRSKLAPVIKRNISINFDQAALELKRAESSKALKFLKH